METIQKTTGKGAVLLQALLCSLLGIILIVFPQIIFHIISTVLAIALFLVGISAIWTHFTAPAGQSRWYVPAGGVAVIVLGILLLNNEELLPMLLALAAGIWVLVRSVLLIGRAITQHSIGAVDWIWFLLVGLLGALFAIILMTWEGVTATAVILIGVALLLAGSYHFLVFFQKHPTPRNSIRN